MKILMTLCIVFSSFALYSTDDFRFYLKSVLDFVAPSVADVDNLPGAENGLIVYDTSVNEFKGRANGGFVNLSEVLPSGTILPFAGTVVPNGFLLCNGQTVSRTAFANLFSVIGTSYGHGNNSTSFHVPDLRGRFLRGFDSSGTFDPEGAARFSNNVGGNIGLTLGAEQLSAISNHAHRLEITGGAAANFRLAGISILADGNGALSPATLDRIMEEIGGSESRPRNVTVNYIIKI